jgi:hypothetical protein
MPISPISVVGFARSILARIKSLQQQGATFEKGSNESKIREANKGSSQKITYASNGRSGKVIYESKEATFALYYEFGGGDVVACIDVPNPQNWEKHTGLPLERREEVLNFIGQRVAHDQTSGGSFKIEGNWMNIYA